MNYILIIKHSKANVPLSTIYSMYNTIVFQDKTLQRKMMKFLLPFIAQICFDIEDRDTKWNVMCAITYD